MVDWLKSNIDTILIFSPIFFTYLIYFIVLKISRKRWKAVHVSVQITAVLYIIAVILIVNHLFQVKITSYVIIFLIFLLAVILIKQRYSQTEIILYDGIRLLLRWSFLIFSVSYICLGLYYGLMLLINVFN